MTSWNSKLRAKCIGNFRQFAREDLNMEISFFSLSTAVVPGQLFPNTLCSSQLHKLTYFYIKAPVPLLLLNLPVAVRHGGFGSIDTPGCYALIG